MGLFATDAGLGETEDPRELVRGDAAAIRSVSTSLLRFASGFGEISAGLSRAGTAHRESAAADGCPAGLPGRWATAAEAMARASAALGSYAEAVEAAQARARRAVELWARGQAGAAGREEARRVLAAARQARDEAAAEATAMLKSATELAPAGAPFPARMGDDFGEATESPARPLWRFATGVRRVSMAAPHPTGQDLTHRDELADVNEKPLERIIELGEDPGVISNALESELVLFRERVERVLLMLPA